MYGIEPVYDTVRVKNQFGKQGEKLLQVATTKLEIKDKKERKMRDPSLHFYNSISTT